MTIQLMGRDLPVVELNEFSFEHRAKEAGVWSLELQGWFDPLSFKITIRKSLSSHQKKRVFLHELSHAIFSLCGLGEIMTHKQEEAICTAMENLAPFIEVKV